MCECNNGFFRNMKDLSQLQASIASKLLHIAELVKETKALQAKYDLESCMSNPNVNIIAMTNSDHIRQAEIIVTEGKWDLIMTTSEKSLRLQITNWRRVVNGLDPLEHTWIPTTLLDAKGLECDATWDIDSSLVDFEVDPTVLEVVLAGILIRKNN